MAELTRARDGVWVWGRATAAGDGSWQEEIFGMKRSRCEHRVCPNSLSKHCFPPAEEALFCFGRAESSPGITESKLLIWVLMLHLVKLTEEFPSLHQTSASFPAPLSAVQEQAPIQTGPVLMAAQIQVWGWTSTAPSLLNMSLRLVCDSQHQKQHCRKNKSNTRAAGVRLILLPLGILTLSLPQGERAGRSWVRPLSKLL